MRLIDYDYSKPIGIPTITPGSVDLVISDPPYNIGKKYEDDPTGDRMPEDDYWAFARRAMSQAALTLRPGGTIWWLCPAMHGLRVWQMMLDLGIDLLWDTPIVWEESFSQNQTKRLTCDFRFWFVGVMPDGEVTYNPDAISVESVRQKMGDKRASAGGKNPGRVWKIRRLQGTSKDWMSWHPCQLAPELIDRIILGFSNPGDVVLDAFAGSGSAAMRCREHGRQFLGVERSATYRKLIEERISHVSS